MAKRFTDNEKWKKRFFRDLPMEYKLLWIYILDDCNHAGIWDVDLEVAGIRIGYKHFDLESVAATFYEQIVVFKDGDKWFIPDFICFQYGVLNPNSRVHQSVIQLLERYDLYEACRDCDYIEEKPKPKKKRFAAPSIEEVNEYCIERNNNVNAEAFINFYESKGWLVGKSPMKDWKAAVRTWEKNNFKQLDSNSKNKVGTNLATWKNVKNLIDNKN